MSKDKREGWLRELKEGDEVIVVSRYYENIRAVKKITPTGIIKVAVNDVATQDFDHKGWQRGRQSDWAVRSHLKEASYKNLSIIKKRQTLYNAADVLGKLSRKFNNASQANGEKVFQIEGKMIEQVISFSKVVEDSIDLVIDSQA